MLRQALHNQWPDTEKQPGPRMDFSGQGMAPKCLSACSVSYAVEKQGSYMKGMRHRELISAQRAYPAARDVAEAGAVLKGLRGPKVA